MEGVSSLNYTFIFSVWVPVGPKCPQGSPTFGDKYLHQWLKFRVCWPIVPICRTLPSPQPGATEISRTQVTCAPAPHTWAQPLPCCRQLLWGCHSCPVVSPGSQTCNAHQLPKEAHQLRASQVSAMLVLQQKKWEGLSFQCRVPLSFLGLETAWRRPHIS